MEFAVKTYFFYFDKSDLILNTNELKYKLKRSQLQYNKITIFSFTKKQAKMQFVRTIINKQGGGDVNSLI